MAFAASAQAAPPTVVYLEDFENTGNTAILLSAYQGAAPAQNQPYSAAPGWLRDCNGWVMTGTSPVPADTRNCTFWTQLRAQARSLGALRGLADPNANHAVTAYTNSCGDPASPQFGSSQVCGGANQVQWQTQNALTVPPNRFYTFSVDAAYQNCHASAPLFDFSIVADATEIPTSPTPINGCSRGNGAYTFTSPGSIFVTSASIGLRMRNRQGSAVGNDGAFDNVRLLDVTPTLHKAFSAPSQNAGQIVTLTFTVENTDELTAKNGWSFTDDLPPGLVVASPANASTTCPSGQITAAAGGDSVAMTGNLGTGQASCTVSVDVTSSTGGTYSNCAANVSIAGLNPPACATTTFTAADLEIAKRASPSPVVPGENVTYELVVTNHGPDEAVNASISDDLPDGLTLVSASPECSEAAGILTCAVGNLPAGPPRTYTVTMSTPTSLAECPANTASIRSQTADPNPANDTFTICPPIRGRSNLAITKTASTTTVAPGGGQVMYTLVVSNDGPSDDPGVKVTDALPAGLTLVTAEPSQGTCETADNTVSCELGTLKDDGSAQVLVTANTTAAPGCITNTARVQGAHEDPDGADNQGSAQVCVQPPPEPPQPPPATPPMFDLEVDKRASATRVVLGQRVTYTIVVTNNGAGAAPEARVTDTYNARATLVSVRTSQGSCTRQIPVTCELGRIEAGGSATITVVLKPRETGTARNAASATSCCGSDTEPANSIATVDVRARRVTLRLSKVASRASVQAGDTLRYRVRVRNPTRGEATDVRVCDRLPSGLTYVSSKPSARRNGSQRCWTIERLGARKSRTFQVTVRAAPGANGRLTNTASVTSPDITRRVRARDRVRVRGVATPITG